MPERLLDELRSGDRGLLARLTRRMINYLCWRGLSDAEELLLSLATAASRQTNPAPDSRRRRSRSEEQNVPQARYDLQALEAMSDEAFGIAQRHLTVDEIEACLRAWIREDRAAFVVEALEKPHNPLPRLREALKRFLELEIAEEDLPPALQTSLRVALLRRFFTDQIDFINHAKRHTRVADFYELLDHLVAPEDSHGKLGGKSAGIFLAANIIRRAEEEPCECGAIRLPKTWYIASDGIFDFIRYNHLDDVYSRKYMDIDQVRQDYPHLVQVFKNSYFTPEFVEGLSVALHDFGERPLIVRSSSLLEDRSGSAFSGKYKSLFLANQGSWQERLEALTDAIAEVYASIFAPDPIEYRAERNLLDVHEEMGIMIQEVVGTRVGRYFFPAFSGVAFSNNEFRWSPRISRSDGLLRLVPGLGTRAVDRVSDDYPILIAPGQPTLRANVTPEEAMRYSPGQIDLINLETNTFETHGVQELIAEVGMEYPQLLNMISVIEDNRIGRPSPLNLDVTKGNIAVTFEGLVSRTPFVKQMRALLEHLEAHLDVPVDVEFASDGENLYLLQCRPQSYTVTDAPSPIPADLDSQDVVFSARRYVSNGRVPPVTHIVYVDPVRYNELEELAQLKAVGRTVGRLNKLLPRRGFILMGPGRWGSRGDIKLGVSVGYSEINNTSVLVEIARRQGSYVPDLSFGTHFFQDLVEAGIRYLPLYPDDEGVVFDEAFFLEAENQLARLLPDAADLAEVIRVVDVSAQTGGKSLRVLMNADLDYAVGLLVAPGEDNFFVEEDPLE